MVNLFLSVYNNLKSMTESAYECCLNLEYKSIEDFGNKMEIKGHLPGITRE